MAVGKKDLASRVSRAVDSTPSLSDRLKLARDAAPHHPAPDVPAAFPASKGEGPRFETVPIDLIDPNPYNARKIYRPERVSELAASIGAHGQDVPGVATRREGRYVLAAGHYRLRAIRLLGLRTMNLMVHEELTDRELFGHSYRENAEREGQTSLDNALCWSELLNLGLFSGETELAEATGMSLPNVNKTLKILDLSPQTLEIVSESPASYGMTVLYELVLFEKAAGPEAAISAARQIAAGDLTRKDLQAMRAKIEDPKERKRKETSRAYRIQRDGVVIGTVKVWDSGRILLDVALPNPVEVDEILADMRKRFGIPN